MKSKLYIILFFLILQSCITGKFTPADNYSQYKKVFADTSKSYIYRAGIKLYDNDFSGLIIIKPESEGHRVVFLNEIGMKFFDFEILKNSYKVHHIFEPMNKKMLIKLLINDFRLILMSDFSEKKYFLKEKKSDNIAVQLKKVKEIYIFDKQTLLPENAFKYSVFGKNTFLKFEKYKNEIPQKINIKHKRIKFEMFLTFIK
ncbi:MAG: hypothetical protein L3J56_08505 [Bacteroidales bacterium]|nr:hypothetical protein [Bacteroidales bacterium]